MAAFNIHLYEDTRELLELYNKNIAFKNSFQRLLNRGGVTYRGRPLKTYVKLIAFIDPQYNKYLQSSFNINGIDELFDHFYNKNTSSFDKLEESIKTQTPLMPLEAEEEIAKIEALPDGEEKQKKWQEHENKKERAEKKDDEDDDEEHVPNETTKIPEHTSKIKPPLTPDKPLVGFLDLDHFTKQVQQREQEEEQDQKQIQIPRHVAEQIEELIQEESSPASQPSIPDEPEAPSGEPSGSAESAPEQPSDGGGGGGNRLTQELEDRAARRLAGAARGASRNLARGAGRLAVQGGARLGALAIAGAGGTAGLVVVGVILIAIFIAIFVPMFQQQQKDEALLMKGVALAATTGSEISQCKFTRSDQNPKELNYKSNALLQYFQNASNLTGIPSMVLAAFMRVESPGLTNFSDEQITNYQCAKSPTGALGVMQIQPKGTRGHDAAAVANGSRLLGIPYDLLDEADYCDVKKSIVIGAGFILTKMSYNGFGDGTKWDSSWTNNRSAIDSLVKGYYGCLEYGGSDPLKCEGPYNYGNDVFTSIQACQALPTTPIYNPGGGSGIISCPVNGGSVYHGSKVTGGHCDPKTYKFHCTPPGQPGYTGRETAVDVRGSDRNVFLPNLGGNGVEWTIVEDPTKGGDIKDSEGGGKAVTAVASYNGHNYSIRFVHLLSTSLKPGQKASSATPVGQYNGNANHVHITLQEDGVYKPADLYFNLCK